MKNKVLLLILLFSISFTGIKGQGEKLHGSLEFSVFTDFNTDADDGFSIESTYIGVSVSWAFWVLMGEPVYDVAAATRLPNTLKVFCKGKTYNLPKSVIRKIHAIDINVRGLIEPNNMYGYYYVNWDVGAPAYKSYVGYNFAKLSRSEQGKYFSFHTPTSPSWNETFFKSSTCTDYESSKVAKEFYNKGFKIRKSTTNNGNSFVEIQWNLSAVSEYIYKQEQKELNKKLAKAAKTEAALAQKDTKKEQAEEEDFWNTPESTDTPQDTRRRDALAKEKTKLREQQSKLNENIRKAQQEKQNAIATIEKKREFEKNKPKPGSYRGPEMIKVAGNGSINTFYIGKTEITVAEYRAYCKATGTSMPNEPRWGWHENHPIVNVNWYDANNYCKWMTNKTGRKYSLPTEKQWEYAARGGNKSNGYTYSGSDNLSSVAWYTNNSGSKPHTVATKRANELGIYDMSGNVWEWCLDNHRSDTRVLRGGSWFYRARSCRVENRYDLDAVYRINDFGFRVVFF